MRRGKWWRLMLRNQGRAIVCDEIGSSRPARKAYPSYPRILMVAAVIGAAADLAIVLIQIGRTAGWWP
jgi:hypothetical protein